MSSVVADGDIVAAGPRAVRMPSRRTLVISGAVLIIVAALATFTHHWWTVGRFIESTDDAYVGGDITVIAPKVGGFIADVAVADNQTVHAGDLLVKLDDRDYGPRWPEGAPRWLGSKRRWPTSKPRASCSRR